MRSATVAASDSVKRIVARGPTRNAFGVDRRRAEHRGGRVGRRRAAHGRPRAGPGPGPGPGPVPGSGSGSGSGGGGRRHAGDPRDPLVRHVARSSRLTHSVSFAPVVMWRGSASAGEVDRVGQRRRRASAGRRVGRELREPVRAVVGEDDRRRRRAPGCASPGSSPSVAIRPTMLSGLAERRAGRPGRLRPPAPGRALTS